jgi:undecaprenyl-diphosphatase
MPLLSIDTSLADWAHRHVTGSVRDVLRVFTDVGQPRTVIVLAIVLAVVQTVRTRSPRSAVFLLVVVGGNALLTTLIKDLVGRVRPDLDPIAATLGPSFPSGHSSYSAAFFAAAAFLLGRGHSRRTQVWLMAAGVSLAIGVAASRVLLSVHYLSDVVAGLMLGWAWFAVCALALPSAARATGSRSPSAPAGAPRP